MEPERLDGRRCLGEDEIAALTDSQGRRIYGLNSRGLWSLRKSLEYGSQARSVGQSTSQGVSEEDEAA